MVEDREESAESSEEQGDSTAEEESTLQADRVEMYKMATELLRATLDGQTQSLQNLNDKSIDIVRFNQVVIGAIVTAFALAPELEVNVYLVASILSFLISLWFCVLVYSSENRPGGIRPTTDILDDLRDLQHYHTETIDTYNTMIRGNRKIINKQSFRFRAGLWSSFAGVLYFSVAMLRTMTGSPPQIFPKFLLPVLVDSAILVVVAIVAVTGWYLIQRRS